MLHVLDKRYWERRAEQELTAAQDSTDERVVRAHYEMLGFYLDLLYPPAQQPLQQKQHATISL